MELSDDTWINSKLIELGKSPNRRTALADWFNKLSESQRKAVLLFAGWQDIENYFEHHMWPDNDKIFDALAESLGIE